MSGSNLPARAVEPASSHRTDGDVQAKLLPLEVRSWGPPLGQSLGRRQTTLFLVEDAVRRWDRLAPVLAADGLVVERHPAVDAFLATDHPARVGCVLVETTQSLSDSLSLLERLQPTSHRIAAVLIAEKVDIPSAVSAVRTGAFNVFDKTVDHPELICAIQQALASLARPTRSFSPKMSRETARAALTGLTGRQGEILTRILQGQPNKIIAADLGISQRTAENHRAAIMKKAGVSSISGLVQMALAAS